MFTINHINEFITKLLLFDSITDDYDIYKCRKVDPLITLDHSVII